MGHEAAEANEGVGRVAPKPTRRHVRHRVVQRDVSDLDTVLTFLRGGALPPVSAYKFMSNTYISSSSSSSRRPAQEQPACFQPRACFLPADRFNRVRYLSELLRQVRQFHRHGSITEVASVQLSHPHLISGAEEYLIRQRLRAVPLIAENVALPDGSHPPVDILPLLPPHLRERYEKLEQVADLARLPPLPQRLPRSRHPRAEYVRLVQRMHEGHMLDLSPDRPLVINRIFCVLKPDGTLRIIVDCRGANLVFDLPERVVLPNPSYLAKLSPEFEFLCQSDLQNWFHQLLLPVALRCMFGLMPVTELELGLSASSKLVWPRLRTCPMGWSHSVLIAQTVHQTVLSRAPPVHGSRVLDVMDVDIVDPLPGPLDAIRFLFIDDANMFTVLAGVSNQQLDAMLVAYAVHGFIVKLSKLRRAARTGLQALGVDWDGVNGIYRVSPDKVRSLRAATRALLLTPGAIDVSLLATILGKWLWVCLTRRPALALFDKSFTFVNKFRGTAQLWPSVRRELAALCAIAPLLYGSTARHSPVVLATDASSSGYGVVYCDAGCTRQLLQHVNVRGCSTRLTAWHSELLPLDPPPRDHPALKAWVVAQLWKEAIGGRFRVKSHINRQEVIAALLGVRWLGRQPRLWGSRVFLLLDSTVACGALAKGRSSAAALRALLRRFTGLCFSFNICISFIWVSTAINPADGPSRGRSIQPIL